MMVNNKIFEHKAITGRMEGQFTYSAVSCIFYFFKRWDKMSLIH